MKKSVIHQTACIHPKAVLEEKVEVGPYCVVDEYAILRKGVKLHSHVCITGRTEIGEGTEIFPFVSIGHKPQDLKYDNEPSRVVIGKENVIREYVTINPGTAGDNMITQVGDKCLLMVGVHIAHDCVIGNNVIIANNATLAGHIHVDDHARLGGMTAYHQKIRIGKMAMIGGGSIVVQDVIPYGLVVGERAYLEGLNIIGMRRSGVQSSDLKLLQKAYQSLFIHANGTIEERMKHAALSHQHEILNEIIEFILNQGPKGICMPKKDIKEQ